jgi:hypothetical protein
MAISSPGGTIAGITQPAEKDSCLNPKPDRYLLAVGGEDCVGDVDGVRFDLSLLSREKSAQGLAAPHGRLCYDAVLGSIGSQMLILRVSGIRKRASTKHTAGTAIG